MINVETQQLSHRILQCPGIMKAHIRFPITD